MPRLLTCSVVLCAAAVLALANDNAAGFTFTTIDPPGSLSTFAFGIDFQGDILGNYTASDGFDHGFLFQRGAFTTIDVPGVTGPRDPIVGLLGSYPRHSNPQGDLVGFYTARGVIHGFLRQGGAFTTIDFPGAAATLAFDINLLGDIVGWYIDSGFVNHGFLLRRGAFTTIDFPGAAATRVLGNTPLGGIVGFYAACAPPFPCGAHGFVLQQGIFTTIDPPGSTSTEALGIDLLDDIVGWYTASGVTHGFLLDRGAFTTIDPPGSIYTYTTGINPQGTNIVGIYIDNSFFIHGYVAK
jgi:hypothetical protein